ncbi:hypothetical protein ABZW18_02480 [Streptomyces sp. NPDC004647]|uniref:hypothetical protein n=1 Tax=Streptomyces sp. NPDC004647 TaxID=3154671 RepID=UPI0033B542A1
MAGRRSGARRRGALCAALLLALPPALAGCGGAAGSDDTATRAIERMLDRRADALLDRDADGFLAAADPRATGYRAEQRRVFSNLEDVPLKDWQYRLTGTGGFEPARGEGRRIAAEVRLSYRLEGYDTAPVTAMQRLTLTERDGRWYVAAENAGPGGHGSGARQLWDQGKVTVARGSHSLVLGAGQEARRLRAIARTADRTVPAVDDAWRGRWAHRVVVLVPESLDAMGELLGAPGDGYRGIAAVTTGEAGGAGSAPADRVIVNPDAYALLGEFGQQVILTHETAHVATRANTSGATPLWLSEGFADWAGYRGTDRAPQEIAPELTREVTAGQRPRQLPRNDDFGFAGEGGRLAAAYEGSWLACRMIADRWGEDRLREFYRAAAEGEKRQGAVDRALREVLGVGLDDFTARWRGYVTAQLG